MKNKKQRNEKVLAADYKRRDFEIGAIHVYRFRFQVILTEAISLLKVVASIPK
jgi:hypothetical protein